MEKEKEETVRMGTAEELKTDKFFSRTIKRSERPILNERNIDLTQKRERRLKPILIRPKLPHPDPLLEDPDPQSIRKYRNQNHSSEDETQKTKEGRDRTPQLISIEDSDKEDNIGKKVVICDLCRKSKDSLVNSMVCNECIHQKKKQLLKWVAAAAFIFLVLIIGILAYYLIEEKIKNEDLNTKLVKVENRYNDAMLSLHNTKIFWINEERAKIYMGQELYECKVGEEIATVENKLSNCEAQVQIQKSDVTQTVQRMLILQKNIDNIKFIYEPIYQKEIVEKNICNSTHYKNIIIQLYRNQILFGYNCYNMQKRLEERSYLRENIQNLDQRKQNIPETNILPYYKKDILFEGIQNNLKSDHESMYDYIIINDIFGSKKKQFNKFELKSEILAIQNLNARKSEYFIDQLEFYKLPTTYQKEFYTVSKKGQIAHWSWNSTIRNYTFTDRIIIPIEDDISLRRGALTSNGNYIVVGSNSAIYLLDITNNFTPTNISVEGITFNLPAFCFSQGNHNAICVDYSDTSFQYTAESNTNKLSPFKSIFSHRFYMGIETIDKLIVLGTNHRTSKDGPWIEGIVILANNGLQYISNIIDYDHVEDVLPIRGITEVRKNILLTANGKCGCFLYNISNLTNIRNPKRILYNTRYNYYSVISLTSNEGYFAVGGGGSNEEDGGFVQIYNLTDNKEADLLKNSTIEDSGCKIFTIKEIKPKLILFGGSSECMICFWNYAAWPDQNSYCWYEEQTTSIYDFISVPN